LQFFQYLLLQSILPTAADFSLLRVLGRGGFGLVTACRKKDCGRLFAAKAMNKRRVQLKHAESLALVERELLALVDSQFIVCMRFAYTSPTELVMVLELMTGGDLRYHMSLRPKHVFSADTAKYYTARAVSSQRSHLSIKL
jgi:beta-adrenergic-receptor kinase